MNLESEDDIIEDMEHVAAEMKNDVELNKKIKNLINEFICNYIHIYL